MVAEPLRRRFGCAVADEKGRGTEITVKLADQQRVRTEETSRCRGRD
jgi:hypothetical protein